MGVVRFGSLADGGPSFVERFATFAESVSIGVEEFEPSTEPLLGVDGATLACGGGSTGDGIVGSIKEPFVGVVGSLVRGRGAGGRGIGGWGLSWEPGFPMAARFGAEDVEVPCCTLETIMYSPNSIGGRLMGNRSRIPGMFSSFGISR